MAEQNSISLLVLPAEILYRICDFLDTETLLLSLRNVCIKFYAITNAYNRYKITFHSISKPNLCRIIQPENVISLDFGIRRDKINWIHLCLPLFKLYSFNRLHSLSLHMTNINDLNIILHNVANNCRLRSFAIYADIPKESEDTFQYLFEIFSQPTLKCIIFYSDLRDNDRFVWPMESTVEKLSLHTCTIEQLCSILENSPNLHSLIMNSCHVTAIDESLLFNSYQQVTSLTFNDIRMTMDKLEFLLSLLPSIVHLDLASSGRPFEFARRLSQWEEFIKRKLPDLSKLEVCIFCYCSNWKDFESLIAGFRTRFWLEEKRWFVTCQFRDDWTSSFTLFTSSELSKDVRNPEDRFDKVTCFK